jgi:hypothetical protein
MENKYTTIAIKDRELIAKLKIKAIEEKITLNELVERYLKESLKRG